ncbi:MAG: ABC transporter substrate-binding protein [Acidimicrobiaceae bacterium]|nr:ABC transporter substrate-binding protein [Acidimicrobiaceae bacterium]MYH00376.1 ABC transporter substrate-binding protein [Acidimicrobiaceae bacterium]MYL04116.1 ABC transporter substrate-binding protein [Acidimicrobiaceae bacterium]
MGELVLNNETQLKVCPSELFALFGSGDSSLGWLFGAEVPQLRPGSLVRLALPLGGLARSPGTARVLSFQPDRRIDLMHETPWAGRVVCRFDPLDGGGTRLRVRITIDDREVARLGAELGLLDGYDAGLREVPLGLLISLSGPAGILGRSTVNCAQLAVEEINADGGVMGRTVRLVVADDSTDPGIGAIAMRRLCRTPGLAAVVGMHSSATYAVTAPMAVAEGIPYLYTPTSEPTAAHPLLVRFGETPMDQLHRALPRMAARTGGSRWFLAGNDYSWPRAISATARAVIERMGGHVAGEGYLPLGSEDFEPVLMAIQRSGVDHVVSSFVGQDHVGFQRDFAACGLRESIRTFAPLMDDAVVEHLGESGEGTWNALGYFVGLDTSENREFLRCYADRFGPCSPPVSAAAEGVYEAIHTWARSCRAGGGADPTALLSGLRRASFNGPRRCGRGGQLKSLLLGEATASGVQVLDELPAAHQAS